MNPEELRFDAGATHPDLGGAVIAGKVRFTQFALRFESETEKVEFPLDDAQVEWLRACDPPLVVFRHPRLPGWTVTADDGVLEHPVFSRRTHLREQLAAVERRREVRRRWVVCGWFLAVFALVSLAGWGVSRLAVPFIVNRIPIEYEVMLGEKVFKEMEKTWRIDDSDTNHMARLNRLKDRLTASLPPTGHDIRLHVVHDPVPNAFALPGGRIFVNTGLLRTAKTDAELAGVLAHELAHVRHRHTLRQIVSAGGPALLVRVVTGDNEGLLGALSVSFEFLLSQRFSRDFEREADESGWDHLVKADIDPRGMIRMMEKFQEEETRLGALPKALQPMSSHPPTDERVERLHRLWDQFPDKERFTRRQSNAP